MLEPLCGLTMKKPYRGGRQPAQGLSATDISQRCGYSGHYNIEISRVLDTLVEQEILRTVYPFSSKIKLYALNISLGQVTLYDLVSIFDYGIKLGEPDIHRDITDYYRNAPKLKNLACLSDLMKEDIRQRLSVVKISDITAETDIKYRLGMIGETPPPTKKTE